MKKELMEEVKKEERNKEKQIKVQYMYDLLQNYVIGLWKFMLKYFQKKMIVF